nr:hypothetical protein Iba_chr11fCG0670 [Ipomoea batatas]GMD97346.1 hypothetical protein Iba_scaffold55021CG0020 [Ipomoea batatas]GME16706.1 hypothetical protein Iba_scaffold17844CG0200 [Ipomoea batatas]GME19571.1 hypothetical protein Iba_scaffold23191CG0090 [Ipomoea batatas]
MGICTKNNLLGYPIFFRFRYISTGKYTTIGQKLIAPATPTTWLKSCREAWRTLCADLKEED